MDTVDCHTHVFPDAIAQRTVTLLAERGGVTPALDGTAGALLASMDRHHIAASVVCCIATRPEQYASILRFCQEIRSPRLLPFPSVHPADPQAVARIGEIARQGFLGLKMHPFYQEFRVDEERLFPLYRAMADHGLVLLLHAGDDIGFPPQPIATPEQIARVQARFADLRIIAAHLGGWRQWEAVERYLLGGPVYLDLAFSLPFLGPERARRLLDNHDGSRLLFGSDSPWEDQGRVLAQVQSLGLPPSLAAGILGANARRLLPAASSQTTRPDPPPTVTSPLARS